MNISTKPQRLILSGICCIYLFFILSSAGQDATPKNHPSPIDWVHIHLNAEARTQLATIEGFLRVETGLSLDGEPYAFFRLYETEEAMKYAKGFSSIYIDTENCHKFLARTLSPVPQNWMGLNGSFVSISGTLEISINGINSVALGKLTEIIEIRQMGLGGHMIRLFK